MITGPVLSSTYIGTTYIGCKDTIKNKIKVKILFLPYDNTITCSHWNGKNYFTEGILNRLNKIGKANTQVQQARGRIIYFVWCVEEKT